MTVDDLFDNYNLSLETLNDLENAELLSNRDIPLAQRRFSNSEVESINRILTLKNAGIDLSEIKKYISWEEEGESTKNARLNLLIEEREKQVCQLHRNRRNIDRLDYLIHNLKNAV